MRLAFDPTTDGYHFSNNDIEWSWAFLKGKNLCGGMIYSALDYWWAGMEIPQTSKTPPEGDPVQVYIVDRQWTAHQNTVFNGRVLDAWEADLFDNLFGADAAKVSADQFELLKQFLKAGQPMPVFLHKPGHAHHTLGFAASDSDFSFSIYNPNFPDSVSNLRAEHNGIRETASFTSGGKSYTVNDLWRGFLVDNRYSYKKPPRLDGESGWRMCYTCRLIYFGGDTAGTCPKGGSHYALSKTNYVLNKNAGHGQSGWKKCWKCLGLYYAGDPSSAGLCPAGGIHNPELKSDYTLPIGGFAGQSNWRRCIYCEGLFWLSGGGIGGMCPAGNRHESDLSKIYDLVFT
jgi:hypothetical protein